MSFDDHDSDDEITGVHLSFDPTNISHFIYIIRYQRTKAVSNLSCETKPAKRIPSRMLSDALCTKPTSRPFVGGDTCNVFNSNDNEKIPDPYFPKLF